MKKSKKEKGCSTQKTKCERGKGRIRSRLSARIRHETPSSRARARVSRISRAPENHAVIAVVVIIIIIIHRNGGETRFIVIYLLFATGVTHSRVVLKFAQGL